MSVPGLFAIATLKPLFLLGGALGGYLLLLFTNPVRAGLHDGLRATRRYSALWSTLGLLGFFHALFQLLQRAYFHWVQSPKAAPAFVWAREAWRDPNLWLSGSPQSLWYLPHQEFLNVLRQSVLPALESLAGIFNNLVTTFPVSAVAALLLLVNWDGQHGVLLRALRKRFGRWSSPVHLAILLCATAALAKPLLYVLPQLLRTRGPNPAADLLWFQWAPVVVWLSSLFEYFFGLCIQIYLILLAYTWVRGMSFTPHHLLAFAIRRLSFVVKWAALVMLLSSLCIEAPLILKNFAFFADWFPENELLDSRLRMARAGLTVFLLLTASMQITLTFHSESLRKAFGDHARFVAQHWWPFSWFLIAAAVHLYALNVAGLALERGLGEGTALWVIWTLVFPWVSGFVYAWLLASWVCVFRRCEHPGRILSENLF